MLLFLAGCSGVINIENIEDLAAACEAEEPEDQLLSVFFEVSDQGCPWGQDGNLQPQDARWSARVEQTQTLDLPEGAIICDLTFEFEGLEGGQGQDMEYDDNFLFLFNGIVLATSYAPVIDELDFDGDLPLWAWENIVGKDLSFNSIPTWCLGEETGDSSCSIPAPETEGTLALSFGGSLVDQLAFNALENESYDFTMIGTGDNDENDCSYSAFEFEIQVPVIVP